MRRRACWCIALALFAQPTISAAVQFPPPGMIATAIEKGTLQQPWGIAGDAAGNIYIADATTAVIGGPSSVIWRFQLSSGALTRYAGNGSRGLSGDNGPALSAQMSFPLGVALDAAGNLFIADQQNGRIRKVDTGGTITTVFTGFDWPSGVAMDPQQRLLVADANNAVIWRNDTIIAGILAQSGPSPDGLQATTDHLVFPFDVAAAPDGTVYIAERQSSRVRRVAPNGIMDTIAGDGTARMPVASDEGKPGKLVPIGYPQRLALDPQGNVYFGFSATIGSWGRTGRIAPDGTFSSVAGIGTHGDFGATSGDGDGGPATAAGLWEPHGLWVDGQGHLWITQTNGRVRVVTLASPPPTFTSTIAAQPATPTRTSTLPPTASPTASPTVTPSMTPTVTPSMTPTVSLTATLSPTRAVTATNTAVATSTVAVPSTATRTFTFTARATATATVLRPTATATTPPDQLFAVLGCGRFGVQTLAPSRTGVTCTGSFGSGQMSAVLSCGAFNVQVFSATQVRVACPGS